ncbi:RNA polymerase sigma factor [bacterium SCSIO 12741]|nr:RNA polymerase sigma factor [bacterium SCSIO 12741]
MSCTTIKKSLSMQTYQEHPDEELMARLGQGNKGAFDELYRRYKDKLFYYFYRMLAQDREKAEDFLQDLFMRIIEKPGYFDTNRSFRPWVYSVAHNMVKNEYKKMAVRQVIDRNADASQVKMNGHDPLEATNTSRFKERLYSCLNEMDEDRKTAFLLKYHEGFSLEEIAAILDIKVGTVKSRLYYVKAELAEKLKDYDPRNGKNINNHSN